MLVLLLLMVVLAAVLVVERPWPALKLLAGVTLARVFVGDTDVGLAQVARGMAWARSADGKSYEAAEQSARAQRKGLWRDDAPTPPWLWRCC